MENQQKAEFSSSFISNTKKEWAKPTVEVISSSDILSGRILNSAENSTPAGKASLNPVS